MQIAHEGGEPDLPLAFEPLGGKDRPHLGKDLDIRMLTLQYGRERSYAEYSALLAAADFEPGEVIELHRDECLISASPG